MPNMLTVPYARLTDFGARALSVAGPVVWSLLPDRLRAAESTFPVFIRRLKIVICFLLITRNCRRLSAVETVVYLLFTNAYNYN